MRVGYARVSTSDQNPELQLDALRRAGCERVFTEKASGARDDRPELARILEDVLRAGDTLVVWKLDRLARSLKKLIATAEELEREQIGLVSLTESIDTTTPGGMLTFHVFGAIAQFERALIRERTTAGLVEARRQGRKGGRPSVMRPSDVTAARAMMKEGTLPVRDIAKRMGVSVATLYRYAGKRGSGVPAKEPVAAHG
ncbi:MULTISPECIES: recombinase family protein [Alphaproteobacteria]|jgi:DNA invertase Pin-like site-specific DNA recombinase|uniref:DNA invertase n=1 Tax=Sphingomonas melonis TaxID=152682 RepID=A0A0D1MDT0_9SPHN|nr:MULTISPECIES: recombinase family protein [Alphaproteobacteria]KIU25946.1 DNA invertase [Sphingomonas melonis]KQN90148.1 DNA invertase [Sphingomonas sp. Leaf231]